MKQGMVFNMTVGRSKCLLGYLVLIHIMLVLTIMSLQPTLTLMLLFLCVLSCSFAFYCYRYQWLSLKPLPSKLARDRDGLWHMDFQNGKKRTHLELTKCFVSVNLVILNFKTNNYWQVVSLAIFADAVDKELLRQLRVYLREPKTFQQ